MPSLELPCSSCKNRFPMEELKCPSGSQSVVCKTCLLQKGKGRLTAQHPIPNPSLTSSKDWPVVGMSKQQMAEMEKEKVKSKDAKIGGGRAEQYKCLDCGYRFVAHAESKVLKRCPYCSKTRVQKIVNLIQDVDSIGTY